MKLYRKQPEVIYAMATIDTSYNPTFQIAVNPGETRKGDPYFKVYNAVHWESADSVARIRFLTPTYVKKHRGKKIWVLNSTYRKHLQRFLSEPYGDYPSISTWQYTVYMWNLEKGFVTRQTIPNGMTRQEAFFEGYFDIDENLENPDYLPSYIKQPDYTKLETN